MVPNDNNSKETEIASTAAEKLLGITELLENILLRVDLADLIRCLSVNKHFNHAVISSASLRKKLYLNIDKTSANLNPLLAPHLKLLAPFAPRDGITFFSIDGITWRVTCVTSRRDVPRHLLTFRRITPVTFNNPRVIKIEGLLKDMHLVHGTDGVAVNVVNISGKKITSFISKATMGKLMDRVKMAYLGLRFLRTSDD